MYIPSWILVMVALGCLWYALPHILQEWSDMRFLNRYCDEIERRRNER
jgi:hypothetical protein